MLVYLPSSGTFPLPLKTRPKLILSFEKKKKKTTKKERNGSLNHHIILEGSTVDNDNKTIPSGEGDRLKIHYKQQHLNFFFLNIKGVLCN